MRSLLPTFTPYHVLEYVHDSDVHAEHPPDSFDSILSDRDADNAYIEEVKKLFVEDENDCNTRRRHK